MRGEMERDQISMRAGSHADPHSLWNESSAWRAIVCCNVMSLIHGVTNSACPKEHILWDGYSKWPKLPVHACLWKGWGRPLLNYLLFLPLILMWASFPMKPIWTLRPHHHKAADYHFFGKQQAVPLRNYRSSFLNFCKVTVTLNSWKQMLPEIFKALVLFINFKSQRKQRWKLSPFHRKGGGFSSGNQS